MLGVVDIWCLNVMRRFISVQANLPKYMGVFSSGGLLNGPLLCCLLACSLMSEKSYAQGKSFNLDIKAKKTDAALLELAEESGVHIIFSSKVAGNFQSPAVKGRWSLQEALQRILNGTNLVYEVDSQDVILVKERPSITVSEQKREIVLEDIVVTGTRLHKVDTQISSPVLVIDSDMISKRGFTSMEEVFRSLPSNFSSTNSASWLQGTSWDSRGASTVNLRGVGEGYTLVLINGKRISESPGAYDNYTDITTIPFGAVERIEVMADGGGAIYGADAVAGVVNIILKRDFQGAETGVRIENSSTGADSYSLDQTLGWTWLSGSVTASMSYKQQMPVYRAKTGLKSDLRSRGGRDWRPWMGGSQSIIIADELMGAPEDAWFGVLPEGDGTNVSFDEIDWVYWYDYLDQTGTYELLPSSEELETRTMNPESKTTSAWITLTQDLPKSFSAHLDLSYSKRRSITEDAKWFGAGLVPASNYYNQLGQNVVVYHGFVNETKRGLLPVPTSTNDAIRMGVSAGLKFNMPLEGWSGFANIGYSDDRVDHDLLEMDIWESPAWDEALASSDPGKAINLFGDGSVQVGNLKDYLIRYEYGRAQAILKTLEFGTSGTLFSMPGGDVRMAIGGEYRIDRLDLTRRILNPFESRGVPERQLHAAYLEFIVPLVSEQNSMPGIQQLTLDLAARHETYKDAIFDGEKTIGGRYGSTSPKVGFSWYPAGNLKIRGTMGFGFKSPSLQDKFEDEHSNETWWGTNDPANPDFNGGPDRPLVVTAYNGGNPQLREEKSFTTTLGVEYSPSFLPGFSASVTCIRTDVDELIDEVASIVGVTYMLKHWQSFPENVHRDENGVLQWYRVTSTNISKMSLKSVDFELNYDFANRWGDWGVGVMGTYTGELTYNIVPGLPPLKQDGTENGPERWKGFGFVEWQNDNWGANLYINYSRSYDRVLEYWQHSTQKGVKGLMTIDAQVKYEFQTQGLKLSLGVKNLFDQDPPLYDARYGMDTRRYDLRRRVFYLGLDKSF